MSWEYFKTFRRIWREQGFLAALKYDNALSFTDKYSASKTIKFVEKPKVDKMYPPQQIENTESLYTDCLSQIRRGIAIEKTEVRAREIAKTAGFPIDSLELAVADGVKNLFDECVLKVKKGINVSFYEDRGRELAERYMIPIDSLEAVIVKGRKREIRRCILISSARNDEKYMQDAESLAAKYGFDLGELIEQCRKYM